MRRGRPYKDAPAETLHSYLAQAGDKYLTAIMTELDFAKCKILDMQLVTRCTLFGFTKLIRRSFRVDYLTKVAEPNTDGLPEWFGERHPELVGDELGYQVACWAKDLASELALITEGEILIQPEALQVKALGLNPITKANYQLVVNWGIGIVGRNGVVLASVSDDAGGSHVNQEPKIFNVYRSQWEPLNTDPVLVR